MAERTQEEINKIIDGIDQSLRINRESDGGDTLQAALRSYVLSTNFKYLVKLELKRVRLQGVLDGINYTRGEGELTDIAADLRTMEIMSKYLPPSSELMRLLRVERKYNDIVATKGELTKNVD